MRHYFLQDIVDPKKDSTGSLLNTYSLEDQVNALRYEEDNCKAKHLKLSEEPKRKSDSTRNCGIFTDVRKLLQPEPKSRFEQFDCFIRESIYKSNINEPLGKTRKGVMNAEWDRTFGCPTKGLMPLYEIVLPLTAKGRCNLIQIEKSVIDFEKISQTHGKKTKRSANGVRGCLKWLYDPAHICVINDTQGTYIDRTKPIDGKVLEPIKNRQYVPEDHAYGKPSFRQFDENVGLCISGEIDRTSCCRKTNNKL